MNAPRQIEIIGGGLAGLSLGLALQRQGISVTLFEAGEYPRHRVCGEFISGLDAATIARLELAPLLADAVPQRTLSWYLDDQPVLRAALPQPALGISRHTLDQRLARAFVTAGGTLRCRTRVADLASRAGRVFAQGRRRGDASWIGLKVHAKGLSLSTDLEFHLGNRAYVGLSHLEDGSVNVCGLFRRESTRRVGAPRTGGRRWEPLLDALLASGLSQLRERLLGAEIDAASFCAVAALGFDRRVPRSDLVAIGDACAMIPPYTGDGMAMAFQSAAAALDPLLAYAAGKQTWAETCRATNRILRGRFRVRLASAAALHPFLLRPRRQRVFAALARARLLPFQPLYDVLH